MDIRYTADHEWVALDGAVATVGITDYAQRGLGDLVFVQLPEKGTRLMRGKTAGVVESVKAASDIYAPLTGQVLEINSAVIDSPELVNTDPKGAGWLFKLSIDDLSEVSQLLDENAYGQLAS